MHDYIAPSIREACKQGYHDWSVLRKATVEQTGVKACNWCRLFRTIPPKSAENRDVLVT